MPSTTPTPWAVHCSGRDPYCGAGPCSPDIIYLTHEEYVHQMHRPDATWRCPSCGGDAWWDDDNYEKYLEPSDEDSE